MTPTAFVVEDSALVRRIVVDALEAAGVRVLGVAGDGLEALEALAALGEPPDVITVDLQMPRLDGLSFIEYLMHTRPARIVVVSGAGPRHAPIAMKALSLGALDFVPKPSSPGGSVDFREALVASVRAAAVAPSPRPRARDEVRGLREWLRPFRPGHLLCLAVAASTGGPQIVEAILHQLPRSAPLATVVVQHMPAGFTRSFSARLDARCALDVEEATDGGSLRPGLAIIAPGDRHLVVAHGPGGPVARVRGGAKVNGVRPSADLLFASVAETFGSRAMGLVLSGMGRDGAGGLKEMRAAGAETVAQAREGCAVWGMPAAALEEGGAGRAVPVEELVPEIVAWVHRRAGG